MDRPISVLKKLEIIQNRLLRLYLGAMRSTPVEALRTEAQEPPLDLRRRYLAEKFLIKHLARNTELVNSISKLNLHDLTNKYWKKKCSQPLLASFTTYNILTPKYGNSSAAIHCDLKSIINNYHDHIQLFTDGSKS